MYQDRIIHTKGEDLEEFVIILSDWFEEKSMGVFIKKELDDIAESIQFGKDEITVEQVTYFSYVFSFI